MFVPAHQPVGKRMVVIIFHKSNWQQVRIT